MKCAYSLSQITKGGVAESDGRLQVGQRILEVDGNSLLGATHVEAVHILRQTGDVVRLLVCDGYGINSNGGKGIYIHVLLCVSYQRFCTAQLGKDQRAGSMDLLDQGDRKTVSRMHMYKYSW